MSGADSRVDVAVVGAGIVGTAIAVACARAGRSVRLIDPRPGDGATYAAAGMLSPAGELQHTERAAVGLHRAAAAAYPDFVASLPGGAAACGYEAAPTLLVGVDDADRRRIVELVDAAPAVQAERRSVREARAAEPPLAPGLSCAYAADGDHRVDPRALVRALRGALAPSALRPLAARRLLRGRGGAVHGVELSDGTEIAAAEVVVANALGAADLGATPPGVLRPVHGDILRLHAAGLPRLAHTVRSLVRGRAVYLVPRVDGGLVVGATEREDADDAVSAGGVSALLRDAAEVMPLVDEYRFVEATARARPATPDHLPLVGRTAPGLVVATGTHRNGVLLAPLIADLCRRIVDDVAPPCDVEADLLDPGRFAPSRLEPGRDAAPRDREGVLA